MSFKERFTPKLEYSVENLYKNRKTGRVCSERDLFDELKVVKRHGRKGKIEKIADEGKFEQIGLQAVPRGFRYFFMREPEVSFYSFKKGDTGEVRKQA